jgi:hypothetical protein
MHRFRHSSSPNRVAISVIALYALFLQGFFAAAAEAAVLDSRDGSFCGTVAPGQAQPPGGDVHHHSLCCILACAACGCTYLAADGTGWIASERHASPVVWLPALDPVSAQPLSVNHSARGPPGIS